MSNMFQKLDEEMLKKIHDTVDDMGGELTEIDLNTKTIGIDIGPEDEMDVYKAVDFIINEYAVKKRVILKSRPFYRAQMMQNDLVVTDD